ncbi:hypothetical protein GCM10022226_80240 [Sphaerisporangium flaviroseum]|uniref:Uncharacterized protein n=1 Tax=Sphaerisporangium flaviroseum TaxID=509199 RepID=A0ABP7JHC5_9ACTN
MEPCLPYVVPDKAYPGSPCMIEEETDEKLRQKWTEICLTCGRTDRSQPLPGRWWERYWRYPLAIVSSRSDES